MWNAADRKASATDLTDEQGLLLELLIRVRSVADRWRILAESLRPGYLAGGTGKSVAS